VHVSRNGSESRVVGLGIGHSPGAGGGFIPATALEMETFFVEALDDQLEKIVAFYTSKERQIIQETETLIYEILEFESAFEANGNGVGSSSSAYPSTSNSPYHSTKRHINTPASPSSLASAKRILGSSPPLSPTSSSAGPSSPSRRRDEESGLDIEDDPFTAEISSPPTLPPPSISSSSSNTNTITRRLTRKPSSQSLWTKKSLKTTISQFKKRAIELFVTLNELEDYRTLNRTGFSKILKKFEKVTGLVLKGRYLSQKVDARYPFTASSSALVKDHVRQVVELYAKMSAEKHNIALAKSELESHLREHLVWERNTVWRDMVERERRTASVETRRPKSFNLDEIENVPCIQCFGVSFFWPTFLSVKVVQFILFSLIFVGLVWIPIFKTVEQQNCFAILVYASLLWAFEVFLPFNLFILCCNT
jgi:phosphate transporter